MGLGIRGERRHSDDLYYQALLLRYLALSVRTWRFRLDDLSRCFLTKVPNQASPLLPISVAHIDFRYSSPTRSNSIVLGH